MEWSVPKAGRRLAEVLNRDPMVRCFVRLPFDPVGVVTRRISPAVGEIVAGEDVTDELAAEMWQLWCDEFEFLGDEETRLAHFDEACRSVTSVGIARSADGRLVGFWTAQEQDRVWQGRRFTQVYVQYYVIRRGHRGALAPYVAAVRGFLGLGLRHPGRPIYVVAGVFPGSYIAIRSGPTEMVTTSHADPWQASLLDDVAAMMGKSDWDPASGLILGHQIPKDALLPHHPRGEHARLFAEYEDLNPTWREGTVLPVLVRVHLNPFKWIHQLAGRGKS